MWRRQNRPKGRFAAPLLTKSPGWIPSPLNLKRQNEKRTFRVRPLFVVDWGDFSQYHKLTDGGHWSTGQWPSLGFSSVRDAPAATARKGLRPAMAAQETT